MDFRVGSLVVWVFIKREVWLNGRWVELKRRRLRFCVGRGRR